MTTKDETVVQQLIDEAIDISNQITAAKRRIKTLGEDRRHALRVLVRWGLTQREIAKRTGLTQPRVAQIVGKTKPYRSNPE